MPRSIIICAGVHDRDKVAGRHRPPRRADGEAVSRVLRGVAAARCGRPNVAPAVVARLEAAPERGKDRATQAADPGSGGRVPGQGEEEEEVPGEEKRAEGGQNAVGHTADVHHYVDAVQHTSAAETVHGGHRCRRRRRKRGRQQGVGDAGHVGLFLLPVLHQQHHQPGVLRPVQRHVPHDLRADTQVQVEHPQAATALPCVMMTAAVTAYYVYIILYNFYIILYTLSFSGFFFRPAAPLDTPPPNVLGHIVRLSTLIAPLIARIIDY